LAKSRTKGTGNRYCFCWPSKESKSVDQLWRLPFGIIHLYVYFLWFGYRIT